MEHKETPPEWGPAGLGRHIDPIDGFVPSNQIPTASQANLANIPQEMRELDQWVLWRSEWSPSGFKKPPISQSGYKINPVDPSNHLSFEDAVNANPIGKAGIGFALTENDNLTFVDLDNKEHDPAIEAEFQTLIAQLNTYTERSPSGSGYHLWFKGKFPQSFKTQHIEIYSRARYATMTGDVVLNVPIVEIPDQLRLIHSGGIAQPSNLNGHSARTDEQVLAFARNNPLFPDLYEGRWEARYKSQSEADLALVNILAPLCEFNPVQIERIWRSSSLDRDKLHSHPTYVGDTIAKAISDYQSQKPNQPVGQAAFVASMGAQFTKARIPFALPNPPRTIDHLRTARLTRPAIIPGFMYADVGLLNAPGGTGKTTLLLWMAVHIALGLPLWGMEVTKPGPVLIISKEDDAEIMYGRLNKSVEQMGLPDDETSLLLQRLIITDLIENAHNLTKIKDNVVVVNDDFVQDIEISCASLNPVLIVFDPAISFGVGEARINDAEQGLVAAARRLVRATGACVLFAHHTGQEAARNRIVDQYSGRGGSAFADGARMVWTVLPLDEDQWSYETNNDLVASEAGLMLHSSKMTYARRMPPIYLKRDGFAFERYTKEDTVNQDEIDEAVYHFILGEYNKGQLHTQASIEKAGLEIERTQLRTAFTRLIFGKKLEGRKRPGKNSRGARDYLHPIGAAENIQGELITEIDDDE